MNQIKPAWTMKDPVIRLNKTIDLNELEDHRVEIFIIPNNTK